MKGKRTRRTLRGGDARRPLLLERAEADGAGCIDVRVVELGGEGHLGCAERVVCQNRGAMLASEGT